MPMKHFSGNPPVSRNQPAQNANGNRSDVGGSPPADVTWVMPTFQGRNICDQGDDVNELKREGRFEEALALATGCLQSMAEIATRNPANAMEHYVIEVCKIQHKMKRYTEQVSTIEAWLALDVPAPREDFRLDLHKRLAKAQELLAKQEGRDATAYTERWRDLVARQKTLKGQSENGPRIPGGQHSATGRSASRPTLSRTATRSRFIPSASELLSPEFVAVDFETANRRGGVSACQVALVKLVNGRVIDRLTTYLQPPPGWGHFEFTYLHGISLRDTAGAPMWDSAAEEINKFVAGLPVYAHNASFDSRIWRDLDVYFGVTSMPDSFFCTFHMTRRAIPGLDNHKPPTVVHHCAPHYRLDHHRAESDAEACGLIVAALQQQEDLEHIFG